MNNQHVIDALNRLWTSERALIDQYVARSKVTGAWGETELSERLHEFAFDEMREVSSILDRIVELGGIPSLQQVDPVRVGDSVDEQLKLSIDGERATIECLERTLAVCGEEEDATTAGLLGEDLAREREHLVWLEAELAARLGASRPRGRRSVPR